MGPCINKNVPEPTLAKEAMTLRDYFAAKAMNGFVALEGGLNPDQAYGDKDWAAATARVSYALADAMMEARKNA